MKIYKVEKIEDGKVKFEGFPEDLELEILLTVGLNTLLQVGAVAYEDMEEDEEEASSMIHTGAMKPQ